MRLILFLNSNRLKVYLGSRHSLEKLADFSVDKTGQAKFSAFLQQQPTLPCQLLTDLIEEEFREVALPHTRGRDRRALHERHRARLFRTTSFRSSCNIGRQRSGRRDDRILFSALTNPELLQGWIDILDKHHMPLRGIVSLPILSRRLLKPLGANERTLLITQQGDHSLRESFISKGKLHFSRLAPLSDSSPGDLGRVLIAEVEKTRRYLLTLKLLTHDEGLDIFVINEADRLAVAQQQCPNQDKMRFHFCDIAQLAAQIGCQDYPSGANSEALFIHLLLKSGSSNHYAQAEHRRNYFTVQWRKALRIAAVLTGTAGLLWSGLNLADGLLLTHQSKQILPLLANSEARILAAKSDLPHDGADAAHMVSAVNLAALLDGRQVSPRILLELIGHTLTHQPELALDGLEWFRPGKGSDQADGVSWDNASLLKSLGRRSAIVMLSGHIRHFTGDYVKTVEELQKLAIQLAAQPWVTRAELFKQPFNSASNTHLEGTVGGDAQQERAPFTLRIVMELDSHVG